MSEVVEIKEDPPLTAEQQAMLEALQKRYSAHPLWHANVPAPTEGEVWAPGVFGDIDLKRFMKARKYVPKDIISQLDGSLKWRNTNDVNNILDNPPELAPYFKKVCQAYQGGLTDKYGRPVYIQCPGKIDVTLVQKYITIDCAVKCQAYTQECIRKLCREQTLKLGRPVTKLLSIVDLTGLSTDAYAVLDLIKAMFAVDERYYPETLGNTLVINAPSIFPMIYSVVKKFLDPDVAAKVIIANPSDSEALLIQFFDDLKVLPIEITPQGSAGLMPVCNLKEIKAFLADREAKTCTEGDVSRGSTVEYKLQVDAKEKPQWISWWFRTDGATDYSVSYLKDGQAKSVDVKKLQEVDAHKIPVEGFVYMRPGQSGTITLTFKGGTFSGRHITYSLTTRDATDYEIANRTAPAKAAPATS